MDDETPEDINAEGFDVKTALSGRDKKISEQKAELEKLQAIIDATPPPSSDGTPPENNNPESSPTANGGNEGGNEAVLALLKDLQTQFNDLRRNSVDAVMNVDDALDNKDFVEWADSTKTEAWNPQSETIGQRYANYLEEGNMRGMKSIMDAWNKHASPDAASGVGIKTNNTVISATAKKNSEKADELDRKAMTALNEKRFKDALNLKNEANELRN